MAINSSAWRCSVCGFVHQGAAPPDQCPVCGAPKSAFEPFQEVAPVASPVVQKWRCAVCGYVHEGPTPPDMCPVCGASRNSFEAVLVAEATAISAAKGGNLIIVGGCIAAVAAAEAARRSSPDLSITILSKETRLPYYRLNLTRLLAGEIEDDLTIHPAAWYAEQRITIKTDCEVKALSPESSTLTLPDGSTMKFDQLILATGAHAFVPEIPGGQRPGVLTLRSFSDAQSILSSLKPGLRCTCIGGGLLGLETAGALARRGAQVTLLESHGYLMPRQLNRRAAEKLKDFINELGIQLRTEAQTAEILGDPQANSVRLKDGSLIPADLVVIAAGVRPTSYLARQAGLQVKNGVVVNPYLQTSHPQIRAAGDVAEYQGVLYGAWMAAQYQGSIAGLNAAGVPTLFGGLPRAHTLKVLGLAVMSIGRFEPEDGGDLVLEREGDRLYHRLVLRDNRLVGAVLLGDTSASAGVKQAIEKNIDCSKLWPGNPTVDDVLAYLAQAS